MQNAAQAASLSFKFYTEDGGWGSDAHYMVTFLVSNNNNNLIMSTPTSVKAPDIIDLRKQQTKEPRKPLYQVNTLKDFGHNLPVLKEKEERIAPGTLLGTTHMYVLGAMDKIGAKRVELLLGQSGCHS
ncbi:hypothetical protein AMTRI_Chr07g82300 [Amborella trichopoda]|uniref:uncharacterized protein LOC18423126 isoform X1 n=1 Tax=Amborella trichopoda TaxID=13333 RepID=UPI0009C07052|nr:uncharacterized protein LOC18423126 isoform X1 [Amborella trichopoda]XP_020526561.1 uncharacterized protein LOC18423126 isoform X1 [Amborella trichopoda]XP_020526568.1 uncharacterized protein LOC18423126 isoform X1 [Amborella trichopoda]|eukprot:XP_020526555.1 uncharacterized protein LOC18423126 isoform X1 [Amborella trichopoda]